MDYLKKLAKRILQYEARLILKKYKPKIIAVTGSVGKTLAKEAIYLVLSKMFFVRKSEKSFTIELGIPLTVMGCSSGITTPLQLIKSILCGLKSIIWVDKYPEWLILEMDGDKPGDLSFASSFLSVDILVVTAIGDVPSHVEAFHDIEKFIAEKKHIVNAVKRDGVVVYNADDLQTSLLVKDVSYRKVSCGIGMGSDIRGTEFKIVYGNEKTGNFPTGMSFDLLWNSNVYPFVILESIGVHNEYANLLAFAVGLELKVPIEKTISSLSKYKNLPGRMNMLSGIKETLIIDDSYNASPIAMSQAVSVFKDLISKGKKIVVFGDMLELGKYSAEEHRKLALVLKDAASKIICVGFRMRKLAEELLNLGFDESNLISTDSSEEAGRELQKILESSDIVLVKGSQQMRMERVVEEVMRHPEDKGKLLVRQDPEWLNRVG